MMVMDDCRAFIEAQYTCFEVVVEVPPDLAKAVYTQYRAGFFPAHYGDLKSLFCRIAENSTIIKRAAELGALCSLGCPINEPLETLFDVTVDVEVAFEDPSGAAAFKMEFY